MIWPSFDGLRPTSELRIAFSILASVETSQGRIVIRFGSGVPTVAHCAIGVGVRWKLPMLMIGLDLAQALSEKGQNPRLHLNITQVL